MLWASFVSPSEGKASEHLVAVHRDRAVRLGLPRLEVLSEAAHAPAVSLPGRVTEGSFSDLKREIYIIEVLYYLFWR